MATCSLLQGRPQQGTCSFAAYVKTKHTEQQAPQAWLYVTSEDGGRCESTGIVFDHEARLYHLFSVRLCKSEWLRVGFGRETVARRGFLATKEWAKPKTLQLWGVKCHNTCLFTTIATSSPQQLVENSSAERQSLLGCSAKHHFEAFRRKIARARPWSHLLFT